MDPDFLPVRQKGRTINLERYETIKVEVEKLLKTYLIQKVLYPSWLENVVLVKKNNGKWKVCVDFTDLNKECPNVISPGHLLDVGKQDVCQVNRQDDGGLYG